MSDMMGHELENKTNMDSKHRKDSESTEMQTRAKAGRKHVQEHYEEESFERNVWQMKKRQTDKHHTKILSDCRKSTSRMNSAVCNCINNGIHLTKSGSIGVHESLAGIEDFAICNRHVRSYVKSATKKERRITYANTSTQSARFNQKCLDTCCSIGARYQSSLLRTST